MADYEKKEYPQNALWTKWEGVYEIAYIAPMIETNFNGQSGNFLRGFVATYWEKEGKRMGMASIQFTADGVIAEKINALSPKKGERAHIIGKMSQKKETRFKDDKGQDVYFPTLRVDSFELVNEFETVKPDAPKAQQPTKPQYQSKKEQPKAELVILDDDLPF